MTSSAPQTFVLAGGCFWCLDAVYRRTRGVQRVRSVYTGGHTAHPDYESVCSGTTGHAEAVEVTFDPDVVPAEVVLDLFFTGHDPTTLNRQGYDVGTQYRSAMFPADDEQRRTFEAAIARAQELFEDPVVTTVEPLGPLHEAEDFHQDFYGNQPFNGYCQVIINPKLAKVRKHYAAWLTD
ncbi:peptide-methionine (S)-S-oxide reductase [Kocuria rhizophila]|nr:MULTISPECIES: peptide-methionine (S)-S-oxide reductase MsrA [Kocuria]HAG63540.1 peptide-methionine (S)-S-oxide reductase [Kocuria sp.]ASE10329.1 peptide-methionine (S)-S-oxide reductase [Kocuria rhizophila]MBK4120704.1 peptide-methionine (S)-S-oxide reductase MsrA [Kocuria rhizophila]MCC5674897.1 peptide-methionine (S)-S-oxide reductase MsrA [Kocuria rhizophila]MDV5999359.1 peptide-methionine (S)-S-oxide reductase MsrA [Kocuria rhizophila]